MPSYGASGARLQQVKLEVLSRDPFAEHRNLLVYRIEEQQLLLGAMTRSPPDFRLHPIVLVHVIWGGTSFVHECPYVS